MQTLTTCGGFLRVHLNPCPPRKKASPTRKKTWKNRFPLLSRYSRQRSQSEKIVGQPCGQFSQPVPAKTHGTDLRFIGDECKSRALDEVRSQCDSVCIDKIPAAIYSVNEERLSDSMGHDVVQSINNQYGLGFTLFFGYIIFQNLQGSQAVASTEFVNGMQPASFIGDLGDIGTGFASAFLLIFFSELGDKTFFIAALLAARNSGPVVFIGTFGALAAMTMVSVILGRTFHYVDGVLPFRFGDADLPVDDIAAVCLLVYFGVSTLIEASSSDGLKTKDEQKEAELAVSEFSGSGAGIVAAANTVVSTFLLVFVAEWGDKSFFSTIALAAASSPLGVIGGALAGHAVATLLAVVGGSLLGTFFSEKVIAYIGGALFLIFATVTLIEIVS